MTDLNQRAEQAVLGAMIATGARDGPVADLDVTYFNDRRHQAVFAALTRPARSGGALGRLRNWLTRLPHLREAREISAYMTGLPGACPDPDHLDAYVAMLTQSRRQHQAAAAEHAVGTDRLLGAATFLIEQAQQLSGTGRRTRSSLAGNDVPPDVAALADAIRARSPQPPPQSATVAAAQAPSRAAGHLRAPATQVPAQSQPQAPARPRSGSVAMPVPHRAPETTTAVWQATGPDDLQNLVLADLLQNSRDARRVLDWLPAAVFSDPQRRTLYAVIRGKVAEGLPVDPLIIAWDVEQRSALDPDYVLRTGAMAVAPGTAAALGRVLLADYVCTQRFGPDWVKSPLLTRPAATQANGASPEADAGAVPGSERPAAINTPARAGHEPRPGSPVPANTKAPMILDGPPNLPPRPERAPRM